MSKPLNICLAASEFAPLAKAGGLADVAAALSLYLDKAGHDVRVLLPRYKRIESMGLDIQPVPELSNLDTRLGRYKQAYAIDRARLPGTELDIYLLRCPRFYERQDIYTNDGDEYLRYVLLSRAAIEMCQRMGFAPDIFHVHDWQTALVPLYLRTVYAWDRLFENTRSVLTIHNIGYQGMFPSWILEELSLLGAEHHIHQDDLKNGVVNFLKTGILYANMITTVSPTYAREILGDDYGMGLNYDLRNRIGTVAGILNGVDYDEWNPATDKLIPANYDVRNREGKRACKAELLREMGLDGNLERPVIGIVSRLVGQKGFELVEQVVPDLLAKRDFVLTVLGSGESRYQDFFQWLQSQFGDRVCFYQGYNNRLAHWIEAGSDMFLMPSLYEPCGLNQMYSLRYGSVPIVRETGGLADSVEQINPAKATGDGVLFRDYNAAGLSWALNHALDLYKNENLWQQVMTNGMNKDFSWDRQGEIYVDLYRKLSNKP